MGLFGEVIAAANIEGINAIFARYEKEYENEPRILNLLHNLRLEIINVVAD